METAEKRVVGRPFQPGVSGNPGGRPAESQETKDGKAMLRKAFPAAVETVVSILSEPGAKVSERMDAARYIIDRVLGKSVQPIAAEVTAQEDRPLTLDECFELAEAILAEGRERRDKGA